MNAQRVLGEIWFLKDKLNRITILKLLLLFGYNGPLFIGGWQDFSKIVSNVNGGLWRYLSSL